MSHHTITVTHGLCGHLTVESCYVEDDTRLVCGDSNIIRLKKTLCYLLKCHTLLHSGQSIDSIIPVELQHTLLL